MKPIKAPTGAAWLDIARYAVSCPSPHNTQPFRLRIRSDSEADVIFLPRRGLWVADPHGRFTWLTAGIFVEICSIAAHGLGFELNRETHFSPMYPDNDTETPQTIARLTLRRASGPIADFDPALILDRHTSRLPYDGHPISEQLLADLRTEARRTGHSFESRSDHEAIDWVIELNRQALFHDMLNDPIRLELVRWLRFSSREEDITGDGLSARCLGFSGPLLHSFFSRPRFWTMPGIRSLVSFLYARSMKGVGTIGWLRGPYVGIDDWYRAGITMIRLWLIVARHGYYWQPYGSVITSDEARLNMIRYFGMPDEKGGTDMVWLLLRLGKSEAPPISNRLPFEDIALCG
ncbi:hypothetical protein FJ934_06490 [Mesorhizobium sp. B2-4-12]|uniref:hypothetical protein n=1 Tax=Mesorhizobium sp. B2-4-12 TaxID=2589937 RepID=UPI001125E356|nr:hypothetical protein [Mesorhizobium sp. B2-4-12]TPK97463.1 hypothetical protein FJ934_06490 [Mesorhizobium sp. B2-4-12]